MPISDTDPYAHITYQERVLSEAEESLRLYQGDNLFTKRLDAKDVNLRARVIEMCVQEITALELAIQKQATAEEVDEIHNSFEEQRASLVR